MSDAFDFIIVGGGTAGCLLAHRLSHAPSRPSVLLVEAGSKPEGEFLRAPFHRYTPAGLRPDLDHGFTSTPQKALNDRIIPYTRGKGLGGSTILNFAVYLYGSAEDYNRWAELVGDDSWRWENTKKSFQIIEQYDFQAASQYPHLAKPKPEDHGNDGTVKVSLPPMLEQGFAFTMEALVDSGEKINLDLNSGDPIGIGIFPSSYAKDGRATSATSHLLDPLSNLTVWTGARIHRLKFNGTKVVGIQAEDGRQASSTKEVIICGGFIDTPRLLLLNGIGPAEELKALNIPVVQDLPGVGKQLADHCMTFLCAEVDTEHNNRYAFESNPDLVMEAEALYKKDYSGNLSLYNSGIWGGFLKLPGLENFMEYKALDKGLQEYLSRDSVPTYEFCANALLFPPDTQLPEGSSYLTTVAFLMNPQSTGSVTLRSSNPGDQPMIELAYLEHAYDRRVLREAIRETWIKVYENAQVKKHVKGRLYGPESLSDEHIDTFIKEATTTVWHGNGTVMMGKKSNALACVDSDLRVYGIGGLRVADLSVCPLTPNNHTQTTAYLIGQKAAEKLIAEYQLDRVTAAKL